MHKGVWENFLGKATMCGPQKQLSTGLVLSKSGIAAMCWGELLAYIAKLLRLLGFESPTLSNA